MAKISKHDEYVEQVERFAAYVNTKEMTVGIYNTPDDMLHANKNTALKKLRNLFKYHIQTVIK